VPWWPWPTNGLMGGDCDIGYLRAESCGHREAPSARASPGVYGEANHPREELDGVSPAREQLGNTLTMTVARGRVGLSAHLVGEVRPWS